MIRILRQVYPTSMTYGYETWALNKTMMDKLAVAQRKMERIMLGTTLQDQRRNNWIRDQTKISSTSSRKLNTDGQGTLYNFQTTDGLSE